MATKLWMDLVGRRLIGLAAVQSKRIKIARPFSPTEEAAEMNWVKI
jgi:hypothetical protein